MLVERLLGRDIGLHIQSDKKSWALYNETPEQQKFYPSLVSKWYKPMVIPATDSGSTGNRAARSHQSVCRSFICRNDFAVIYPGRDTLVINGVTYTIRNGNPSVLALVQEMNKITTNLVFSFDSYDGSFYVTNQTSDPYTIGPGTLGYVLGFASEMTIPPLSTILVGKADLAPPSEHIIVRQTGLSDQGFEIDNQGYQNTGVLACIGCNSPAYSTFVYNDPDGASGAWWNQSRLLSIDLNLENADGEALVSANTIVVTYAVQIWRDDSDEQLSTLQSLAEYSKLQLMGQSLK